jgi:hypothetical protein
VAAVARSSCLLRLFISHENAFPLRHPARRKKRRLRGRENAETRKQLGDKWLITVAGYRHSRRATQLTRESRSSQLARFKDGPIKHIDSANGATLLCARADGILGRANRYCKCHRRVERLAGF